VTLAYRHYRTAPDAPAARAFAAALCHDAVPIEMIGVWDTVKALGLRLPLLWTLTEARHAFHTPHLGRSIWHSFHALALDETRQAFAPVLCASTPDWPGNVEQVWFRGARGDVGGQLGGFDAARPLSTIPLVWMPDRAEACGLPLPPRWRSRFPCDPVADGGHRAGGGHAVCAAQPPADRAGSVRMDSPQRPCARRARLVGAAASPSRLTLRAAPPRQTARRGEARLCPFPCRARKARCRHHRQKRF